MVKWLRVVRKNENIFQIYEQSFSKPLRNQTIQDKLPVEKHCQSHSPERPFMCAHNIVKTKEQKIVAVKCMKFMQPHKILILLRIPVTAQNKSQKFCVYLGFSLIGFGFVFFKPVSEAIAQFQHVLHGNSLLYHSIKIHLAHGQKVYLFYFNPEFSLRKENTFPIKVY